jgi:abequosyltransferase
MQWNGSRDMMVEEFRGMNSEKPLLTIAIPTYNRSPYLEKLLTVLFDQLVSESRVELIISDNASPDKTPELVADYRQRGLELRYIRNEMNLGPDGNILQCFEQARGKYVWIFSDDDIIVAGAIAKILHLLASEDYGLVYINPYVFRDDYVAERTSDRFGRFAERLSSGMQFVRRVGTGITFISSMIVNKDHYLTTMHPDLRELVGSNLVQLGWLCPALVSSSRHLFFFERLVAGRCGNSEGYGACQVFGVNLKRVLDLTLKGRKEIAAELSNCTLQGWFPDRIIDIRKGTAGPLDTENMHEVLEPVYGKNWRYWTHVYPLIVLPLRIAGFWYRIVTLENRIERWGAMIFSYISSNRNMIKAPK